MPVPQQRDPDTTRSRLAEWCSKHLADGSPADVGAIEIPAAQGFSNETLLFDLTWEGRTERLVARVAAPAFQVYPDARLDEQYRVLRVLDHQTGVPVPHVHGFEPDPDLLGGPFLVMSAVAGRVPADLPSYHRTGWVADLSDDERATLWTNGLDVLRQIHEADVELAGDDHVEYYADHMDFFRSADAPVAVRALEWLRANRPAPTDASCLLWGDARIGNIIFAGTEVAAVLDWEMMSAGPPEIDLAWYIYLDRHLSEGIGATRLSGLPGRAATLATYTELTGHQVRDFEFYEVLAGFRFALITARVTDLAVHHGIVPVGKDFPLHRNATILLERTLDGVRQ
jgi:aminoglycoside phosphotransferase (APT) family kinase protein